MRDLGAELNVTPMTVSKAYAMLERDGLLGAGALGDWGDPGALAAESGDMPSFDG